MDLPWRAYKIPIILGTVSLLVAVLSIVMLVKTSQTATPIQFFRGDDALGISTQSSESANLRTIFVDIEGSVVRPGVIRLPEGSRVEDAIVASGGLKSDADLVYVEQNVNRAMKVADGMKIYIPSLNTLETSHNIEATQNNTGMISVNTASKDVLDVLPGVGPATAQKIIDNRPYTNLNDLVTKKAIGPSLFEKLKNTLSL
jgi:competence protein ComEA